jgi:hypothetical protein
MSAAARKSIGEATRRRWEAFRGAKAASAKAAAKPKRKMSAEGKARIIAATKKRWAAFHKARKAAAKTSALKSRKTRVLGATPMAGVPAPAKP